MKLLVGILAGKLRDFRRFCPAGKYLAKGMRRSKFLTMTKSQRVEEYSLMGSFEDDKGILSTKSKGGLSFLVVVPSPSPFVVERLPQFVRTIQQRLVKTDYTMDKCRQLYHLD